MDNSAMFEDQYEQYDYQQPLEQERREIEGDPRAWTRWFYESPVEAGNAARAISSQFYFDCVHRMCVIHRRFEGLAKLERQRHVG